MERPSHNGMAASHSHSLTITLTLTRTLILALRLTRTHYHTPARSHILTHSHSHLHSHTHSPTLTSDIPQTLALIFLVIVGATCSLSLLILNWIFGLVTPRQLAVTVGLLWFLPSHWTSHLTGNTRTGVELASERDALCVSIQFNSIQFPHC